MHTRSYPLRFAQVPHAFKAPSLASPPEWTKGAKKPWFAPIIAETLLVWGSGPWTEGGLLPPNPPPLHGVEDLSKCDGSGAEVFSQLCWWLGHPCGGLWEVRGQQGCAGFVGWLWTNRRAPRGDLCCSSKKGSLALTEIASEKQTNNNPPPTNQTNHFHGQVLP